MKKLVINKANIGEHVGRTRTTKSHRMLSRIMRTTDDIETFFASLAVLMKTPKRKDFKVTKYGAKQGKPLAGKYVVNPTTVECHYYFVRELERAKSKDLVMSYLIDNVPKTGIHLIHADNGVIAIEFKQVIKFADQHGTDYAIEPVATLVKSHSRFGAIETKVQNEPS